MYNIRRKNIWHVPEFLQKKIDSFSAPTALLKFRKTFSAKILFRKPFTSSKKAKGGILKKKKKTSFEFDRSFHT